MSKTPRTDEHILHHANGNWHPSAFVLASFARQLETELADARAEIERLKGVIISQITPEPLVLSSYSATTEPAKDERDKLIEQMREALKAIDSIGSEKGDASRDAALRCFSIARAALTAERGE